MSDFRYDISIVDAQFVNVSTTEKSSVDVQIGELEICGLPMFAVKDLHKQLAEFIESVAKKPE